VLGPTRRRGNRAALGGVDRASRSAARIIGVSVGRWRGQRVSTCSRRWVAHRECPFLSRYVRAHHVPITLLSTFALMTSTKVSPVCTGHRDRRGDAVGARMR
jgi:hypothetical protein